MGVRILSKEFVPRGTGYTVKCGSWESLCGVTGTGRLTMKPSSENVYCFHFSLLSLASTISAAMTRKRTSAFLIGYVGNNTPRQKVFLPFQILCVFCGLCG